MSEQEYTSEDKECQEYTLGLPFIFKKDDNTVEEEPCGGKIISGAVVIGIYPTMVTIDSSDITDMLVRLTNMINGNNDTFTFNDTDGETTIELEDDIFTLKWGTAYDMVHSAKLECSYSENRCEINKFLNHLHFEYTKHSNQPQMKTLTLNEVQSIIHNHYVN